jgi:hypothetical protein
MRWRRASEENLGFGRVDITVDPPCPCLLRYEMQWRHPAEAGPSFLLDSSSLCGENRKKFFAHFMVNTRIFFSQMRSSA